MKNLHIGIIGSSGRLGSTINALCDHSTPITSKSKIEEINFEKCDIFLDVSAPDVIKDFLPYIIQYKKPLVIGATGMSPMAMDLIDKASEKIPLLLAPNFSKGIFLLTKLIKKLSLPKALITETHHENKIDKPSGTAKQLSSLFSSPPAIISHREKNAIGTHTVSYELPFEELEITHKAKSLHLFANGALDACSFLYEKPKGLYTMDNVYKESINE